jgi:hypothetical protein
MSEVIFMKVFALVVLLILTASVFPEPARAFGKKKPPVDPNNPTETQAYPTRMVSLGKFLETNFMLPDGKTKVDMSVQLPELIVTEMAHVTTKLRARGTQSGSDGGRYVFSGGITSFEANNNSMGITIGYKTGVGDIGTGPANGVTGKVTLDVSSMQMDFHIVDTQRNEVVAVGRGSGLVNGINAHVDVDFGAIDSAADFVHRSAMAPVFRKAIDDAIKQMASDPRTNFYMDWSANVTTLQPSLKRIFFNAGMRDDITAGNVFTIYDNSNMRLGEAKVLNAEMEQSAAVYQDDSGDKLFNSTKAGDKVKIFFKGVPR